MKLKISRVDVLLIVALGLIGGGTYQLLGAGAASLSVGILLLLLTLLMVRGGAE